MAAGLACFFFQPGRPLENKMAWIAITEADVQSRLAGAELTAFKNAAKASGQADPVAELISQTVDEVRGYIAACSRNTLEAGQKVPSKLKSATLALIVYRINTRLPIAVTQERRDENERADRLMREVAACRFAIEEPTTASDESISSSGPRITPRTRTFDRDSQNGI